VPLADARRRPSPVVRSWPKAAELVGVMRLAAMLGTPDVLPT
jgi:hypothetical protein